MQADAALERGWALTPLVSRTQTSCPASVLQQRRLWLLLLPVVVLEVVVVTMVVMLVVSPAGTLLSIPHAAGLCSSGTSSRLTLHTNPSNCNGRAALTQGQSALLRARHLLNPLSLGRRGQPLEPARQDPLA